MTPIRITWCPRWDKSDALFYWGQSWQMAGTLIGGGRFDLFGWRIQLGPIRISLCSIDTLELETTCAATPEKKETT